jgi:hypothetical protein
MNKYFSPTYGVTKNRETIRQEKLNDDLRKLITESDLRKEQAGITKLAIDSMNKPDSDTSTKNIIIREAEMESAAANLDEVEQTSLLGNISEKLDYPAKHFARPAMAGILSNIFRVMPGEQAGEAALREASGVNPFGIFSSDRRERMRDALKETELPFGVYTVMEEALNPLNYALALIPGAAIGKVASEGLRGAVKLDKVLDANKATRSALDRAMDAKVKSLGTFTPETPLTTAQKVISKLTRTPEAYEKAKLAATATKIGRLADIEERISQVMSPSNARNLANIMVKIPVVRSVAGTLNPGVLAKTAMGRLILGHGVTVADGEKFAQIATMQILAIRKAKPKMVETTIQTKTGNSLTTNMVQFADGSEPKAWGDLFEESAKDIQARVGKGSLTQENADYIREYREIIEDAGKMLEEAGFKQLKDLLVEGGVYIPRFATSREGLETFFREGAQGLSKKQSWMYKRYYDTMLEGLENNVKYMDPEALLGHHLRSVYRTVADQKLLKRMQLAGQEIGSGIISVARNTIALGAKRTVTSKTTQLAAGRKIVKLLDNLKDGKSITGQDLINLDKLIDHSDTAFLSRVRDFANLLEPKSGTTMENSTFRVSDAFRKKYTDMVADLNFTSADDIGFIKTLERERDAARTAYNTAFKDEVKNRNLGSLRSNSSPQGEAVGSKYLFDQETIAAFNKIGDKATGASAAWFQKMAEVNGALRLGSTGFDMGAGFLQGLPLLATNPAKWAIAQTRAIQSFFDPTAYAKYMRQHEATLREMSIDLNATEFVEAWGQMQGVKGALLKAGPIGRTFKAGTDRAARAFTAFTLVARVEMFEALRPMALRAATKRGRNIGDPRVLADTIEELSEHVSKMTGFSSNAKLGISGSRSNVERALFFAPRYLRATTGAVADVFQGGIRGDLARMTLAKMAGGGTIMYVGICAALGQEPQMDPTKKGFMEVSVNGTQFGPGSAWIGLTRTIASLGKADWLRISEAPQGADRRDDESFIGHHIDPKKHVLGYYLRSKSSPVIALGWDIALGKDMAGDEVDALSDPGEFLRDDILGSMIPFWAQTFIPDGDSLNDDQTLPSKFMQAGAEFTGLRSSPTSFFAQQEVRRDMLSELKYGKKWKDLNTFEKDFLVNNDNTLKEMKVQTLTSNLDSTDDLTRAKAEMTTESNSINEKKRTTVEAASAKWEAGVGGGGAWRDSNRYAAEERRREMNALQQRGDFQSAIASNNEYFAQNKSGIALDEAYGEYIQEIVIGAKDDEGKSLYNDEGDLNYRLKDKRLKEFVAKWDGVDPKIYQDILSNFAAKNKDADLIEQRFWQGRNEFEYYWELADKLVEKNSNLISFEIWDDYRDNAGRSRGDALKMQYPAIKQIADLVGKTKIRMRQLNPALDAFLYQFEYTSSFQNATTKKLGKEIIEEYIFNPFDLPMN